jgi:hypothetical protein
MGHDHGEQMKYSDGYGYRCYEYIKEELGWLCLSGVLCTLHKSAAAAPASGVLNRQIGDGLDQPCTAANGILGCSEIGDVMTQDLI